MTTPSDRKPQVVVFTGLPGTGKSTMAEQVAGDLRAPAFAGDWLLGALKPHGVLAGLERPAFLAMYYDLLTTLMTRQLMLGQSAVLDCLVNDEIAERWDKVTSQYDARLFVVECSCSDEPEHRRRVETRHRNIPGWHEIDWAHVERMKGEYPPLSFPHLALDAVDPVDHNRAKVHHYLTNPAAAAPA
jgi:predicted kinase